MAKQIQYFVWGDKKTERFYKANTKQDVIDCTYSETEGSFIVRTMAFKNIPPSFPLIIDLMEIDDLEPLKKQAKRFLKRNNGLGGCITGKTRFSTSKAYCPHYVKRKKTTGFPGPFPNLLGASVVHVLQQNTHRTMTYKDIVVALENVPSYKQIKTQIGALRNSEFVKLMEETRNGSVKLDPIVKGVDMRILTLIAGGESYNHKQLTVLRTDKMKPKIGKLKGYLSDISKMFSAVMEAKEGIEILLDEIQRDSENIKNKR